VSAQHRSRCLPLPEPTVNFLYSLYDALVSINVPSDKARAVVDAMEHDMGTTLATKQDLDVLRRDMENRFALVDQKIEGVASRLEQRIEGVESRLEQKIEGVESRLVQMIEGMESRFGQKFDDGEKSLSQSMGSLESKLGLRIDALELRMTVKLGSLLMLGFGLAIAALRLLA
jgi:hypothetical protein